MFELKSETLSARCEVCHQVDCYDAQIDYCSRCGELPAMRDPLNLAPVPPNRGDLLFLIVIMLTIAAGAFATFIFGNSRQTLTATALIVFGSIFAAIVISGYQQIRNEGNEKH